MIDRGPLTVATWNTEWRSPTGLDGKIIKQRLAQCSPEVVCLTEVNTRFLEDWDGFCIEATNNWGGPISEGRRKVLLWSAKGLERLAGLVSWRKDAGGQYHLYE